MPELAEVEFFRRRWWEAGAGQTARAAAAGARSRVFRNLGREFSGGARALAKMLAGARLVDSGTHGKQMWFGFGVGTPLRGVYDHIRETLPQKNSPNGRLGEASLPQLLWLGIHLGMTGALRVEPQDYRAQKHDALVLRLKKCALVFNDPRQFGRVRAWLAEGWTRKGRDGFPGRPLDQLITMQNTKTKKRTPRRGVPTQPNDVLERPPWLRNLPAEILSPAFTLELVRGVLARHGRAPLKAVLLNQRYFPGVGNWMADEILWRAALPPAWRAGRAATPKIARQLHAAILEVARDALRVIAGAGGKLPPDLNVHIPDSWLFNHRWEDGGVCPKTKKPLRREEIGGRTTCWSPAWQKVRR